MDNSTKTSWWIHCYSSIHWRWFTTVQAFILCWGDCLFHHTPVNKLLLLLLHIYSSGGIWQKVGFEISLWFVSFKVSLLSLKCFEDNFKKCLIEIGAKVRSFAFILVCESRERQISLFVSVVIQWLNSARIKENLVPRMLCFVSWEQWHIYVHNCICMKQ